jgi:hypothetical protein
MLVNSLESQMNLLSTVLVTLSFLTYFKANYLEGDKYIQWCAAFQPQTYTNIETNNFVESWHNQLKSTYLGRKRNRRADRLVYILVDEIEPDFIANTNRIQLNVGRMGPEERRRRRRELNAEAINEEVIHMLIEKVEPADVVYRVKYSMTEGFFYNINVINEEMKDCSCQDFTWNHIACKHMYLLKRFDRNIILFVVSTGLSSPEVYIPTTPRPEQAILSQNEQDSSYNTTTINNFQNTLNNILNNSIQPINQTFQTQRRYINELFFFSLLINFFLQKR